jgi:hypothetical protein
MSIMNSLLSALKKYWLCAAIVFGIFVQTDANAFTVKVVNDTGAAVSGFRWTVEEDNTFHATPGVATPTPGVPESHTLSINVHRSHAPVVDTGKAAGASAEIKVPANKRYLVTVLPDDGFTQSGRPVDLGQDVVTVVVHAWSVPTTQMTILVFEDNNPINAAMDLPVELGLPGFQLLLTDTSGLPVGQDAWARPLGTTYLYECFRTDANGVKIPQAGTSGSCTNQDLLPEQQPSFQLDADGNPVVDFMGDGIMTSCPGDTKVFPTGYSPYEMANCTDPYSGLPLDRGEAVIRFLNANKYTVEPIPPDNDPNWFLTGTLEGTRGNDVWVRAGEPRYNIALGQLNWLAFYGFVKKCNIGEACSNAPAPTITPGAFTINGRIVYVHDSHPPLAPGASPGLPVPDCFVGLNNLGGADEQIYMQACNPDSTFSITGVPPGTYQLAIWDLAIDVIIDFRTITVTNANVAMGDVAVFGWFGQFIGSIFNDKLNDANGLGKTGFRDDPILEPGIPNLLVNLRYSDGSIYKSTNTDNDGNYAFKEVFPWWRFITPEVDFGSYHIPGATAIVDNGGPLTSAAAQQIYPGTGTTYASMGINPQIQPDGKPYRIQLGEVITNNYLPHADMTARMDFAKVEYPAPGTVPRQSDLNTTNGGISGVVYYATTRTEEDPKFAVADPWEPGVPRVQFNLYKALHADGSLDPGQLPIKTAFSDSFDDNNPTGCIGQSGSLSANPQLVNGIPIKDCAETFRTWEQIRPGTFDGAWAFVDLEPGNYIVEMIPPKGYKSVFWGDRNIEFGDPKYPFLIPPAPCVGDLKEVPLVHTLFPYGDPTDFPGFAQGITKAHQCDRKMIDVADGKNSTFDFFIFTDAPKAARIWGAVFNDLLLEFNPNSPNAGGNFTPSWLPVSLQDYSGLEVARAYTDQWGHFDALVPTNYDIAPPIPLGLALSMITIQPNDAGPIDPITRRKCDPLTTPDMSKCITDPFFNPAYSQEVIRENWEFYPGKTTFVDTIVLPVSGFTANAVPLNCDFIDATPEILTVSGPTGGPVVSTKGLDRIIIRSVGIVQVNNPEFNPTIPVTASNPTTITRDHGFGSEPGSVTVGGVPLIGLEWTAGTIRATVPGGVRDGQLVVTRGDNGLSSTVGVTLHTVADPASVVHVHPPTATTGCTGVEIVPCSPIQQAINAAQNGDLIIIDPGSYQEHVVMWKPVQLQGWGAPATLFNGTLAEGNLALKDHQFLVELLGRIATGEITSVPGQDVAGFILERGAGITVAGCDPTTDCTPGGDNIFAAHTSLIDGISLFGATEAAGGLLVNGYADNLRISNNEIFNNQGNIAGGIRLGTSSLNDPATNPTGSSFNPDIVIDHNRVANNGSLLSGAGGIAIYGGSDHYAVTNNMVCGNFSAVYGGGIGHFGLSVDRLAPSDPSFAAIDYASTRPSLIANNIIVSNESFDEAGGIMIGSEPAAPGALSTGAGPVLVNANLIQGNKSGNDGAGVRTLKASGQDVADNPSDPTLWYQIDILNNMIVNNSSADVGGGIALDDTARVFIVNNTVANNDSTSTGSDAFGPCDITVEPPGQFCPPNPEGQSFGGIITSIPQVAGIASNAHSAQLQAAFGAGFEQTFSDPVLVNDIIWHNRTFYWDATINNGLGGLVQIPALYWDLAVTGTPTPVTMSPTYSILTDGVGATPSATNRIGIAGTPNFVKEYFNVYQATSAGTALGNFVTTTFTPTGLTDKNNKLWGDYHIRPTVLFPTPISQAVDAGTGTDPRWTALVSSTLGLDFDGDPRFLPAGLGLGVDIGADEALAQIPQVNITPTALDFGDVPLLQPVQLVLTVRNLELQPLILSSLLNFTGPDAAMFRVTSTDWSGLISLAPGDTAHITVVFKPTSLGQKSAILNIATNDPLNASLGKQVPVTGNGI